MKGIENLPGEKWIQVPNTESLYVSNAGRVMDTNYKKTHIPKVLLINSQGEIIYRGSRYSVKYLVYNVFNNTNIDRHALGLKKQGDFSLHNIINLTYTPKLDEVFKPITQSKNYKVSNYGTILNKYNVPLPYVFTGQYKTTHQIICEDKKKRTINITKEVYKLFVGDLHKGQHLDFVDHNPENTYYLNLKLLVHDLSHKVVDFIESLPNEIWKDVPNFPKYKISNLGRCKSLIYYNAADLNLHEYLLYAFPGKQNKYSEPLKYFELSNKNGNKTLPVGAWIYLSFIGEIPWGYTVYGDSLDSLKLYNFNKDSIGRVISLTKRTNDFYKNHKYNLYDKFMKPILINADMHNINNFLNLKEARYIKNTISNYEKRYPNLPTIVKAQHKFWVTQEDMLKYKVSNTYKGNLRIDYKFPYGKYTYYIATCTCGKKVLLTPTNINERSSCGCIRAKRINQDKFTILCNHKLSGIKRRCYPTDNSIKINKDRYYWDCPQAYNGTGHINICALWMENPEKFRDWLIEQGVTYDKLKHPKTPRDRISIDRLDPFCDYAPWCCKVVPLWENAKKARKEDSDARLQNKTVHILNKNIIKLKRRQWYKNALKKGEITNEFYKNHINGTD